MVKSFTIKEVSKITGLSEYTLRFYEKQGLIINIRRDANSYRQYSEFDIEWIRFLIKIKDTSMPLKEIQKYAYLMSQGNSTIFEREQMLLKHKERMAKQMEVLSSTITRIDEKLGRYQRIKEGIGENELKLYSQYERNNCNH